MGTLILFVERLSNQLLGRIGIGATVSSLNTQIQYYFAGAKNR